MAAQTSAVVDRQDQAFLLPEASGTNQSAAGFAGAGAALADAAGAAAWHGWCDAAGVVSQEFVSNNAVPCGSTIGPITATRIGIRTVDVGIPILSMHSARELAGVTDLYDLSRVARAFFAG